MISGCLLRKCCQAPAVVIEISSVSPQNRACHLALPAAIHTVVQEASRIVEKRSVDLIISNQGHELWVRALRDCGFLPGPSNYILAMSPALATLLEPLATHQSRLHINRGDGDGPLDL